MPSPTIVEYLNYADAQMAAEALFDFNATEPGANLSPGAPFSGPITTAVLTQGNLHASRFSSIQAEKFASQWSVVEHISNTTTGFSGTLLRALRDDAGQSIHAGDLVLSFRSTEFIDDAARDNQATRRGRRQRHPERRNAKLS